MIVLTRHHLNNMYVTRDIKFSKNYFSLWCLDIAELNQGDHLPTQYRFKFIG